MADIGRVIAFSGALGAGTSTFSLEVAKRLGWQYARFSDYIRRYAAASGENPDDRGVLQRLGQALVQNHLEDFVRNVLELAAWKPGDNLILDGLRHVEVVVELRRQLGSGADLRVVHMVVGMESRAARSKAIEGLQEAAFMLYDKDATEAQIERVLPPYADLVLDEGVPDQDWVAVVLRNFGDPDRAPDDREEEIGAMEPMHIASDNPQRGELSNLATQLLAESKDLVGALPCGLVRSIADLVRSMNCYYSNLIEGHDTHPIDIERALKADYNADPKKRELQQEARAHIAVQSWLDSGRLGERAPTEQSSLIEIHRRFCSELPDNLLWAENPTSHERWRIVPGQFRRLDVRVGRHDPPSPGAVSRFMVRFESSYKRLGRLDLILASAAAHHRLLWIHPFADGNGRVARLMSHAMLEKALEFRSLWSIARGLARAENAYKAHLASCDLTRRNDLDGRGNLSQEALSEFTAFFLDRCLDQVRFMRKLMQPDELRTRFRLWVEEQVGLGRLPASTVRLVAALLVEPSLSRSEAIGVLGISDEQAAETLSFLHSEGMIVLLECESRIGIAFPAKYADRLVPGLFPSI